MDSSCKTLEDVWNANKTGYTSDTSYWDQVLYYIQTHSPTHVNGDSKSLP
jgi:hypothetical protein